MYVSSSRGFAPTPAGALTHPPPGPAAPPQSARFMTELNLSACCPGTDRKGDLLTDLVQVGGVIRHREGAQLDEAATVQVFDLEH